MTFRDVRRARAWMEEVPFHSAYKPGVVRVDDLDLGQGTFTASFTPAGGGSAIRGTARRAAADHRLEVFLDPYGTHPDGLYTVRVEAYTHEDDALATVAIPIEGTLTVAQ